MRHRIYVVPWVGHETERYSGFAGFLKPPVVLKPLSLRKFSVKNRVEMVIYSYVNCAFSPIFALFCTHLRGFKKISKEWPPCSRELRIHRLGNAQFNTAVFCSRFRRVAGSQGAMMTISPDF